jgi:hypothetical protein
MAIYTGNNGRMYLARRTTSGLQGTRTLSIVSGQAVGVGEQLTAITVRGTGSGAVFRADNAVLLNATSRTCNFTVVGQGKNYSSTDIIYLASYVSNTWIRETPDFVVGDVQTRGVDRENELQTDDYRIAKIRDWSYNSTSEVIETTALGDVTKTFAPSLTSGEGNATLMFYQDDLNSSATTRTKDIFELVDILFPRDIPPRVIMSLVVDGGSFSVSDVNYYNTNFMFNAYITSASVSVNYGEVVTVATSFTVDGPLLDVPWKPGVVRL